MLRENLSVFDWIHGYLWLIDQVCPRQANGTVEAGKPRDQVSFYVCLDPS